MLTDFQLDRLAEIAARPGFGKFCMNYECLDLTRHPGPISVVFYVGERLHMERIGQLRVLRKISP